MIDTRLKVDGKWNFKMNNVWFLFVMLMCALWLALEAFMTYVGYELTGQIKISVVLIIDLMFMIMALQRREIDRIKDRVKALEDWE